MNLYKEFDIHISKLTLGQYKYSYRIDDRFFELFEYSLVDHGILNVELTLDKKSTFIQLSFDIKGEIRLICDRSLDEFDYPVDSMNELILKFGDEDLVVSDEVEIIEQGTQAINVANYIYEFVTLEIPMKKLHPRFQNNAADSTIVYTTGDSDRKIIDTDPRWNELRKIKNKD